MLRRKPTNILKIISQKEKYQNCQRLKAQKKEKFDEFSFVRDFVLARRTSKTIHSLITTISSIEKRVLRNGYRCKKWTWQSEFKSWTKLFTFSFSN